MLRTPYGSSSSCSALSATPAKRPRALRWLVPYTRAIVVARPVRTAIAARCSEKLHVPYSSVAE